MCEVKRFSTVQEAFDYIREKDKPEVVEVEIETMTGVAIDKWKIFPSGKYVQVA